MISMAIRNAEKNGNDAELAAKALEELKSFAGGGNKKDRRGEPCGLCKELIA